MKFEEDDLVLLRVPKKYLDDIAFKPALRFNRTKIRLVVIDSNKDETMVMWDAPQGISSLYFVTKTSYFKRG
jgi:hypothetical protein